MSIRIPNSLRRIGRVANDAPHRFPQLGLTGAGAALVGLLAAVPMAHAHSDASSFGGGGAHAHDHDPIASVEIPEGAARFILTRPVVEQAIQHQIPAVGRVIADPSMVMDVNAAISGQVAEVYVLPGSVVQKGDPVATVTSPDFIYTQRSYLQLLANDEQLEILRGEGNLPNYLEGARDNLRWWGMTEPQIDELVESGELVQRLNLVAPENGIITEVLVQPGDMIDAGDRTMQNFIVLGRAVARLLRSDAPLMLEVSAYLDAPLGGPPVTLQLPPEPSRDAVTPPPEVADPDAVQVDVALQDAGSSDPDDHDHDHDAPEPEPAEAAKTEGEGSAPERSSTAPAKVRLAHGGPDGAGVTLDVMTVVPDLDPVTQQARALVSLEGVEGGHVLGQSMPVDLIVETQPGGWIPAESVWSLDISPTIYVGMPDGTYERRHIDIEERVEGWVRAPANIETGERIVVRGKSLLEGAYVRAVAGVDHDDHHHHH